MVSVRASAWTAVVCGGLALVCWGERPAAQGKAPGDVYLDRCAVCHGADGAGKTARGKKLKVKDVRETVGKLTADQMADIVSKGKAPDMDAYEKELGPDQIKQIVDYYRGLAKK